jgi:excisionase family DNA binding protein
MARVFRQRYSIPVPEGATPATVKDGKGRERPAVRFPGPDGKPVVAPLTKDGGRCLVPSPNWYGWVPDPEAPTGRRREKLTTNKAAAEQLQAKLILKAEQAKVHGPDPYEKHRGRPLAEHLADFLRHLEAKGGAPAYVGLVGSRLTELFTGCGWRTCADLSASGAAAWLADLRRTGGRDLPPLDPAKELYTAKEAAAVLGVKPLSVGKAVSRLRLEAQGNGRKRRFPRATVEALRGRLDRGRSVQTTNYYLSHLKSFCRWLVWDRRMRDNPLAHLEPANAGVDRRHDRRELDAGELRRVLEAARTSPQSFRGLTGPDRFHLYATACGTGFRAGGLASLTPESFDLDADTPTVTLAARKNKSRVLKVQPLPADVAGLLRGYLDGRAAGAPSGRGPGWLTPPKCSASTWRRPASPTPSRGRTAHCTPTSTRCGTPT